MIISNIIIINKNVIIMISKNDISYFCMKKGICHEKRNERP
jgi:hypothetical protein